MNYEKHIKPILDLICKFICDTLMERNKFTKKYDFSMRRIAIAVCLPYALMVGWKVSFSKEANENGLEVFKIIFIFITIGLGINLYAYLKNPKQAEDNTNNENLG